MSEPYQHLERYAKVLKGAIVQCGFDCDVTTAGTGSVYVGAMQDGKKLVRIRLSGHSPRKDWATDWALACDVRLPTQNTWEVIGSIAASIGRLYDDGGWKKAGRTFRRISKPTRAQKRADRQALDGTTWCQKEDGDGRG